MNYPPSPYSFLPSVTPFQVISSDIEDGVTLPVAQVSGIMGAGGEDLIMSRAARKSFPYSVECKNQEKINVWSSYEQASENSGKYTPIVVLKRNNVKPLVLIDAQDFIDIHKRIRTLQRIISHKNQ